MKKEKDKIVRCGYKVGGGAERDQGFENDQAKEFFKGGKTKKDCYAGGGLNTQPGVPDPQMQAKPAVMANPANTQRPSTAAPQNPSQTQGNMPMSLNYGLKKGGRASAKTAVRQILKNNVKEVKPPKLSAALIESISVIPKRNVSPKETHKEKGVQLQEKAIGGAAKIRQKTFSIKSNPPIKR